MIVSDYESLPIRIKQIYDDCKPEEQQYLIQILQELSEYGCSETYDNLWLEDFIEIPVDILTFVCDDRYLGKTNNDGDAVYPYWKECMQDIFKNFTKYQEIVFTGATRIGKTSTAVTCAAYMLYWLMCLRDPQKFFNKKEISKFSIHFFNVTKDLASGVAYREFNDQLRGSDWFCDHGTFSKSERNFYYIPDGGKVVIDYGSSYSDALGQQVFCLVGNTEIQTEYGYCKLEDLQGKTFKLWQYDYDTDTVHLSDDTICIKTKDVTDTIRITLEDSSIIEGTPEHKVMLMDGTYKMLKDLVKYDELCAVFYGIGISDDNQLSSTTSYDTLVACNIVSKNEKIHYDNFISVYDIINATPNNNFILRDGAVVHNCAVMDECNFARSGIKDINKAKANMQELYDVVTARIEGTFRLRGKVYGKMFAVSSKKTDSDFLENHIQEQLDAGNDHLYVADKPQWEVLPASMFSSDKFYIAVGDRHKKGFVVQDESEESLAELKELGYTLMQVPIDMKTNFTADFDVSLRDLAGISVPGALSFITQDSISACLGTRRNAFTMDVLEIGTKDNYTIEEFFHEDYIDPRLKKMPLYIHLDLSITTDKTGLCGTVISGRKDMEDDEGKTVSMPTYSQLFIVAIQAPRNDKVPFAKITSFIVWLRKQGFNIQGISKDTFQSEYVGQLLEAQGFDVTNISLDRTPDGYMALRSIILEQRIDLLDEELYQDELIHLQRDGLSGKIDHPVGGCLIGSTEISLVDGRTLNIEDLLLEQEYKQNWVYTVNEDTHKIEPKKIKKVFQTKLVTDVVEVTLDNGEKIYCTPEHRFMLIDGSYEEAENLCEGISLMPLYRKISDKGLPGYRLFYNPFEDKWHYEHQQFCKYEYKKHWVVHHANYNRLDNSPTNLIYMSKSEHRRIHNNSTQDYSKISDGVKRYHEKNKDTDTYLDRNNKISNSVIKHNKEVDENYIPYENKIKQEERIKHIEETFNVKWDELSSSEKDSYGYRYTIMYDPSIKQNTSKALSKRHKEGRFKNAEKAISGRKWYTNGVNNIYIKDYEKIPDGYYAGRTISDSTKEKIKNTFKNKSDKEKQRISDLQSQNTSNRIWITNGIDDKYIQKDDTIPEGYYRGRTKTCKNHKVVSVKKIHYPCKVYDLEIEDNHNFALASGIFVHNSKDSSDALAGSVWNATMNNGSVPVNRKKVADAIASVNSGYNGQINSADDLSNIFGPLYRNNKRK